jgi:ATP synthase protein I
VVAPVVELVWSSVNPSEEPSASATVEEHPGGLPPEPDSSMQEYYTLQRNLLVVTLVISIVIFFSVWVTYSLSIALNYLVGAWVGVVYLRMLGKSVEQLGRQRKSVGNTRLALLIGLILIASQWKQLQILPIFLGFLTYKAALMIYVLWTSFASDRPST